MERSEFISRAQRYAATGDEGCLVTHGGATYYPQAYILDFELGSDQPRHLAILHDLHAISITQVPLHEVESVKKEQQ